MSDRHLRRHPDRHPIRHHEVVEVAGMPVLAPSGRRVVIEAPERMHRTLKAETAKPAKPDLFAQQEAFDVWRKEYNEIRPHEALGQEPPANYYEPSLRRYPEEAPDPEYPSEFGFSSTSNGSRTARFVKQGA